MTDAPTLIPIPDVRAHAPWWPYSPEMTWRMVRNGRLRAVVVGRRKWLTEQLLRDFVHEHTQAVAR